MKNKTEIKKMQDELWKKHNELGELIGLARTSQEVNKNLIDSIKNQGSISALRWILGEQGDMK